MQKSSISSHKVFEAIKLFYSKYKHYEIPRTFVITKKLGFPIKYEGLAIGEYFHDTKHNKRHSTLRVYLESAGILDSTERSPEFDQFVKAARTYRLKHSNLLLHSNYVIPSTEEYEKDLWEYPLGSKLYAMVVENTANHRHELASLGFNNAWNFYCLRYCISIYKQLNNSVKIPYDYVIPMNSAEYPVVSWNLPLGQKLKALRFSGAVTEAAQISELEELGVDMRYARMSDGALANIYSAVRLYRVKYNHINIPPDYVIMRNDYAFLKTYWNMRLGELWSQVVEAVE